MKRTTQRLAVAMPVTAILLVTGCNNAGEGALTGAAVGAGSGAAIGAIVAGGTGAWMGAAAGAVGGAVGGAIIGDQNARNGQPQMNGTGQYNPR